MSFFKIANNMAAAGAGAVKAPTAVRPLANPMATNRGLSMASKVKERNSRRFWPADAFSGSGGRIAPGRQAAITARVAVRSRLADDSPSDDGSRFSARVETVWREQGPPIVARNASPRCSSLEPALAPRRVDRPSRSPLEERRAGNSTSSVVGDGGKSFRRGRVRTVATERAAAAAAAAAQSLVASPARMRKSSSDTKHKAMGHGHGGHGGVKEGRTSRPVMKKTLGQMAALLRAFEATNRSAAPTYSAPLSANGAASRSASDVRMFDRILQGYEETGRWRRALGLLTRMISGDPSSSPREVEVRAMRPDASTFGLVVSTCVKAGRWREATNLVLREMPTLGVTPDLTTYAAVMDACSKWGRWKEAVDVLDAMVGAGLIPTVAMYNNVLTLCGGGGRSQLARDILDQMLEVGVVPNVSSYNSVMTACEHVGEWQEALSILRRMQATPGVTPNVRSFNIAIKTVGDGGGDRCETALALFREISAAGISPSTDSYASAVRVAFLRSGKLDSTVLGLLEEMAGAMKTSVVAAADTITICGTVLEINHNSKGGNGHASKNWRHAVGLLREVERRIVTPDPLSADGRDVISVNRSAGRSSKVSNEEREQEQGQEQMMEEGREPGLHAPPHPQHQNEALSLLKDMSGAEIPQTVGSYSLAITKFGQSGRWEEALALLKQMAAIGIPPSRKCYHSAIAACGSSKRHEEALELLRELPKAGFPLTEKSYRCAISALGNSGGQSDECIALLREARHAGIPPNPGSYSLTIMACGDAGRWEKALSLLEEAEALDIATGGGGACYNAAAKACNDCGRPEEAAAVLERSRANEYTR